MRGRTALGLRPQTRQAPDPSRATFWKKAGIETMVDRPSFDLSGRARKARSAVIPILWLIQKQDGWVCEPAHPQAGRDAGMPVIRVLRGRDLLHHVPAGAGG